MKKHLKNAARSIGLKVVYSLLRDFILKIRGYNLLSQAETKTFMQPYAVKIIPKDKVLQPKIADCYQSDKTIFNQKESVTDELFVWEFKNSSKKKIVSKYGSVIIKGNVLCTDRTHDSFYRDVWKNDTRPVKESVTLIAPFSHFQSGTGYGGYFDFVFFVAVKICRIKDAFPDEDFSDAIVSYPPFGGSYEKEYLQLLDIKPDNLIDSSKYNVISQRVITGNGRNWHPNIDDIFSLKKHIEKKFKPIKKESKRIYISRSWRRRIINEEELIFMLKKFDFVIIEDKQRSIEEQISIYHNASFIIGPHGASFGNIIWCEPGTHLFELFSPNYVPDFFLFLTTVMKMNYTAYYEGNPDSAVNYLDGLTEDIWVSVSKIETCLQKYFKI